MIRSVLPLLLLACALPALAAARAAPPSASSAAPTVASGGARQTGAVASSPAATGDADRGGTRLQGRAFLGRRQGVVGASVIVRPDDDPSRLYATSTDADGVFRVESLADGVYAVTVRREGLEPVRKSGIGVRFPFRAVVELPMRPAEPPQASTAASALAARADDAAAPTVSLDGRVVADDGSPLADAVLRFVHADGAADPRVLRSGRDGRFELADVPAGRWEVELRAVGLLTIRSAFELTDDATIVVTMLRQPADYEPSPLELMPVEEPVPPPGLDLGTPDVARPAVSRAN